MFTERPADISIDQDGQYFEPRYVRLNADGKWSYFANKGERVFKVSTNEGFTNAFEKRMKKDSSGSTVPFLCGYFELSREMKEKLKNVEKDYFARYPLEELEKRPAGSRVPDFVKKAKDALQRNQLGLIAAYYLKSKHRSTPSLLHLFGDDKLSIRMTEMLKERLMQQLGQRPFETIDKLDSKNQVSSLEKIESLFQSWGFSEEANQVRSAISEEFEKKVNLKEFKKNRKVVVPSAHQGLLVGDNMI